MKIMVCFVSVVDRFGDFTTKCLPGGSASVSVIISCPRSDGPAQTLFTKKSLCFVFK